MRVTAVETVRNLAYANLIWVRIETDEDVSGLGETFRHAGPVETYVHDVIAPYLLSRDPRLVNAHADALRRQGGMRFLGYPTRSVEIRANSAIDIALWDLRAKVLGLPLVQLLGGPVRKAIPIYNTCAGPGYNLAAGAARARMASDDDVVDLDAEAPDDLAAQRLAPGELAASLLDEGITAMKVWPFDAAAEASDGRYLSAADLATGLGVLARIRNAVGDRMEVLVEYHGLWRQVPARVLLAAVDAYRPFWHEDPIPMEEIGQLAELRRATPTPIAGSESHGTAIWCRDALNAGAVDYLHFDVGWIGGISEALRVSALASAHDRLIAPHDCTGPVTWMVNLHLALSQPHALWLESVRAYYRGFYRQLVTDLPRIAAGQASLGADAPGIGTALSEELLGDPNTTVARSAA